MCLHIVSMYLILGCEKCRERLICSLKLGHMMYDRLLKTWLLLLYSNLVKEKQNYSCSQNMSRSLCLQTTTPNVWIWICMTLQYSMSVVNSWYLRFLFVLVGAWWYETDSLIIRRLWQDLAVGKETYKKPLLHDIKPVLPLRLNGELFFAKHRIFQGFLMNSELLGGLWPVGHTFFSASWSL